MPHPLQLGGDNCSRSTYIGGVMGALYGVPEEFVSRASAHEEIVKSAEKVVGDRK